MKRMIAMILAQMLTFGLAACEAQGPDSKSDAGAGGDAPQQDNVQPIPEEPVEGGDTVATAVVTPDEQQVLYLWENGNVPATTEYTENNGSYFDDPGFRPYITSYPVPSGTDIKGAVLICAGGAFQFRSESEGRPVAEALSERG